MLHLPQPNALLSHLLETVSVYELEDENAEGWQTAVPQDFQANISNYLYSFMSVWIVGLGVWRFLLA